VYHSTNTTAPHDVVEAVKKELIILEIKFREKLEKNSKERLGIEADVDKYLRAQVHYMMHITLISMLMMYISIFVLQ
jgi:RNase P/RNase MRP subunit p30